MPIPLDLIKSDFMSYHGFAWRMKIPEGTLRLPRVGLCFSVSLQDRLVSLQWTKDEILDWARRQLHGNCFLFTALSLRFNSEATVVWKIIYSGKNLSQQPKVYIFVVVDSTGGGGPLYSIFLSPSWNSVNRKPPRLLVASLKFNDLHFSIRRRFKAVPLFFVFKQCFIDKELL